MRARLLDMGEVSAVRSQSIYHAIAATAGADDPPVAVLLSPASELVAVGRNVDVSNALDLESCLLDRIPVLRRRLGSDVRPIEKNRLLLYVLLPGSSGEELTIQAERLAVDICHGLGVKVEVRFGQLVVVSTSSADVRSLGITEVDVVEDIPCFGIELAVALESDKVSIAAHLGVRESDLESTSLSREMGRPIESAVVAEAMIEFLEKNLGLELVPSMPTPAEMEAVYEWDERLVVRSDRIPAEAIH